MAPKAPNGEPEVLVAGDSWWWDKHLSTYLPSEGYGLKYSFSGPGVIADISAATSSDGDYFEVRENAADTAAFVAGTYQVAGYATLSSDRFEIWRGTIHVRQNLDAINVPTKSHDETALEAINAAIEGRLTADMQDFQIGGRTVTHIPIEELLRLQGVYRRRVWRSRNSGGLSRPVEVTFAEPS